MIMRQLRLVSRAPDGDDPRFYSWYVEGIHADSTYWVRLSGDGDSNYDTAVALVAAFNSRESVS